MKASQIGVSVLQDAATANGDGNLYNLAGADHVVVCVSGTFSASVHLEVSIGGIIWHEIALHDLTATSSSDKAKTITSPGIFALEHIGGLTVLRARVSNYSSGAVTVRANAHG